MTPLLSILCISARPSFLDQQLLKAVYGASYSNRVEFLQIQDNNWTSLGDKWKAAFNLSRGEYVMRVDDDDIVHPQLLPLVMPHLDGKNDCVTFNVACIPSHTAGSICRVDPMFEVQNEWVEDGSVQYRSWTHLMPTRRELFAGIDWPNTSLGEDETVAEQIRGKIGPYKCLDQVLYYAFPLTNSPLRRKRHPRYE